jgi:CpeT/CpcT family (DUF1001)
MKEVAAFVSVLLLGACTTIPAPAPAPVVSSASDSVDPLDAVRAQRGLGLLAYYLVGTWDTIPQKEGYGDSIPMRMRIARLWPERADRYWFYVENVNPADERQVMRQRILQFVSDGTTIHALMYRLPGNAAEYAGEWRKEHPFAAVNPESLREIQGCRSGWFKVMDVSFAGGTEGDACPGDRPEVSNEHWDYTLSSSEWRTWIRGLDSAGNQVDGPTGPSEFRKVSTELMPSH